MYGLEDSRETVQRELGIERHTYTAWRSRLQNSMILALEAQDVFDYRVGGENVIVQVGETLLNRKKPVSALFQRCRRRRTQLWAWGAVERIGISSGRFVIILLEADIDHPRGQEALRACLEKYVSPGSRIIHDDWGAYRAMPWEEMQYIHDNRSIVNHSKEAVNVWGEHTNHIESLWSASKRWARRRCGGALPRTPEVVEAMLIEFMWRHWCDARGEHPVSALVKSRL